MDNNILLSKYDFSNITIGFGITGSFCTFSKILSVLEELTATGANIVPIFSDMVSVTDNRFMTCSAFTEKVIKLTNKSPIKSIVDAEPIGPKGYLDIMVIAPCTGNTIAKLCNGITDTPVLMAAKAHLRNQKPLLLSISTNDALGMNFKNIGMLMNMKNIYMVPFKQDDPVKKPNSLISDTKMIIPSIESALKHKQIEPVIL